MRLHVLAVGKIKSGPEAELVAHYCKQIRWPITISEISDAPEKLAREARRLREAELLQKQLAEGAVLVALDASGSALSSEQFSQLISKYQQAGRKNLAFAIGGQDGLHADILQNAQHVISFSPMIWPHKLARVMLCEQIFRAQCIANNHPYHNGH